LRLGFVVPPCEPEAHGEAAGRARELAKRLAARGHGVEVLTTAALPPGTDAVVFFSGASWAKARGLKFDPRRSVLAHLVGRGPTLGDCSIEDIPHAPAAVVFDTPEVQAIVERDRGGKGPPSEVIGPGVEMAPHGAARETPGRLQGLGAYFLLTGPLEAQDGCAVTVERFLRGQREGRAPLTLVLVGRGRIALSENVHVRQLGDLSEAEAREVLGGAIAVLVPSRREALAPSALRAWGGGRPVIAHGRSEVMRGLVARAGGGVACGSDDELAAALEVLAAEPALAEALGRQGRDYVAAHHAWPVVLERWERLLGRVAAGGAAAA